MKDPEFVEKEKYLYLGNNALSQLNIINSQSSENSSHTKSLYDIINFCSTPLGRRLLKESLINPLLDHKKINGRYDMIQDFITKGYTNIEEYLNQIYDIERLQRKIAMKTIDPIDLKKWINSIQTILNLKKYIDDNKYNLKVSYNQSELIDCLKYIESKLNVEDLRLYLINEIETNIFKPKQVKELDDLQDKIDLCKNLINLIKNKLNDIMCDKIKANDTIKVESNDRDGYYLILTKKRSEILRKELETLKYITIGTEKIKTDTFEYQDNQSYNHSNRP